MTCATCGATNAPGSAFCSTCGSALSAAPPATPAAAPPATPPGTDPTRVLPTAAPPEVGRPTDPAGAGWPGMQSLRRARRVDPGRWGLTPEAFAEGDWAGAALACLAGLLVMALLVAVLQAIGSTAGGAGFFLTRMLAEVCLAVGGSATVDGPVFGISVGPSVALMPLTVSIIGFGVIAWLTRRRLRREALTVTVYWLQAVRTLLVFVVLFVVIGFIADHGHRGAPGYVHVSEPFTAFFGAFVLLVVFAGMWVIRMPGLLPEPARRVRSALAGPAAGIATVALLSLALATIYGLVQILAVPHGLSSVTELGLTLGTAGRRPELAALLAQAPNHALWLLSISMGIPINSSVRSHDHQFALTFFTGSNAVNWLLPVIAAVLWLTGAAVAMFYAASPRDGRRNAYRMAWLAPVLTTAVFVFNGSAVGSVRAAVRLHSSFWWGLLLGIVWAAAAGLLAPALVMRLPVPVIRAGRRFAMTMYGAPPDAASPPPSDPPTEPSSEPPEPPTPGSSEPAGPPPEPLRPPEPPTEPLGSPYPAPQPPDRPPLGGSTAGG